VSARGGYIAPSALGGGVARFASLTWMLAVTDLRLRFFGAALGYAWALVRPLMLFGVLYLVFTQVVKFGDKIPHYPVYLLMSIVLFTYFSEATATGVTSVVDRENLLRKIRFPRLAIPAASALTALFNLGLNLIVVVIFALASGVQPRLSWLMLIPIVLYLSVFAMGLAMLLSVAYVRFRDVGPIWDVVLQILFYGSPIFYVAASLPASIQREAMVNPLAVVLTEARRAVLDPHAHSAAVTIGGGWRLVFPTAVVLGAFALGAFVFSREAPRVAENL
jgi:ABC-2 type transport system permease protein